ncbi:hypothetical protein [Notoacmeibacter sp. MSK16QG-6]|uniref:hypothetical protein n=1 Tax=Notoacmeibacter sp. MSK16QG-6 TaxID=2957982 RepID=UPI00209F93AC|nr:hypothetical protein [Notoacmeibacter sp. MSK16QG-6]MCP1199631.1 hypothetical protein [Notoacmeibacter sp. MSK16QG-6]
MTERDDGDQLGHFDLPRETVIPIEGVELIQLEGQHPYEKRHLAAIEEEWAQRKAGSPSLFDGQFCLMRSLSLSAERFLKGSFHMGRFATFLHWRSHRFPGLEHLFAHAVPVLSDGSLLAVRMGEETVNAGQVYFAAGSFDGNDVRDKAIDLHGNMLREVAEETGLDLRRGKREPTLWLWSGKDGASCVFQRYAMPLNSIEAEETVTDFIATETQPELASPVILRSLNDLPATAPAHMAPFVRLHFEQAAWLSDENDGE